VPLRQGEGGARSLGVAGTWKEDPQTQQVEEPRSPGMIDGDQEPWGKEPSHPRWQMLGEGITIPRGFSGSGGGQDVQIQG